MEDAQYYWVDYSTKSGHEFALSRPLLFGDNDWLIVQSNVSDEIQRRLDSDALNAAGPIYTAFTVAELGVMLPAGYSAQKGEMESNCNLWYGMELQEEIGYSFTTQAECLTDILINMIETNQLTAAECNERLMEA